MACHTDWNKGAEKIRADGETWTAGQEAAGSELGWDGRKSQS